ncbi:hypothetical protein [Sphingomonas koreensis]|uniref:hypothetical protein n=2 Tax=Sphingomonas koreensis TaxID=93064 RepID=UPI000F7F31CB|nr:hypothetical protein [Sphingomonas koreensis]
MRIRSVLLAATALAAALPAHAQHSRLDALERRLAEQQARIEQLEALVARQSAQLDQPAPETSPEACPLYTSQIPRAQRGCRVPSSR